VPSGALRRASSAVARRAVGRTALAAAVGVATTGALLAAEPWVVALLGGWDAFAAVVLALSWFVVASSGAEATRNRAAAEDPGRTAIYALVVLASGSSLLAAIVLERQARAIARSAEAHLVALCLATAALSWFLTHTMFALRYAHLYYREGHDPGGGADFPGGGAPTYFDFAYLAFTVGMCFQTSDVTISGPQIRREVLLQAALAFVYNTAVLAFVLNLVFGLAPAR
jgi:uncharacterized membrane protein